MRSFTARAQFAVTLAVTAAAVGAAFLLPVPAMASESVAGSGHVVSQPRTVGAFTALRVEGPFDVQAHAGTAGALVVKIDDNLQPMIETVLDGSTLVLRLARHATFHTHHSMIIDVSYAAGQLGALQIRGSGDVRVTDLTAPRFEASISGSGDLKLDQAALGTLATSISGSGDMTLTGHADEAHYDIAGSGDLHAQDFVVKRLAVSISGSGDADVQATDSLDARVAGSGDIHYRGHPANVSRHVAGSGDIDPM